MSVTERQLFGDCESLDLAVEPVDEGRDAPLVIGGDTGIVGPTEAPDGIMSEIARSPTSRRDFIKGVIASGAAVSATGYLFRGPGGMGAQAATAPGAVERLVTLNVNGQMRRVDVLPQETLAMTLRYKLGLTGTKLGCDRGECGACTVMLDDVTHYSCSTLTQAVRRAQGHHDRGDRGAERRAAPRAAGVRRGARPAMRLLHAGPGHRGGGAAQVEPAPDRRGGATRPCPAICAAAAPMTNTCAA